mgnify:CR=1 FL=1
MVYNDHVTLALFSKEETANGKTTTNLGGKFRPHA